MRYSLSDYSISAARKGWGQGWPTCTAKGQTAVIVAPISGVKVVVHKRIARLAFLLIAETERRGYLLRTGQTWGGNCRAIAGTTVSSNHAWWIAVDINSLANPYIKKGLRVTDFPAWMPLLWNAFGWAWGGAYGDSMHLEFMGSPDDADDMTALAEKRLAPGLGGTAASNLTPALPLEDDLNDRQNLLLERLAAAVMVDQTSVPVVPLPNRLMDAQVGGAGGGQALWANVSQIRADLGALLTAQATRAPQVDGITRDELVRAIAEAIPADIAADVAGRLRVIAA